MINIKKLSEELQQVGALLKKESVVWPYQKMSINEFMRKYFPDAESAKVIEKFKQYPPDKLLQIIENQLRIIDANLGPLENTTKALEFQLRLLTYFAVYAPDKLEECRQILNKTPREIREGFVSEKNLDMAFEKGFSQKSIAELMTLWLNMRYYGALSCALSPKFLLSYVTDVTALESKVKNIEENLTNLRPNVEKKQAEYSSWVKKKQHYDEERKAMTFGPESVQLIENVLETIYQSSVGGELTQKEAMTIVTEAKTIIEEAIKVGEIDKKTLLSKEKREKLEGIVNEISKKPYLFFVIAQISNFLQNGEALRKEHITTLHRIENVIKLFPKTTEEALKNEELKKDLQIIFEPLKFIQPKPAAVKEEKTEEETEKPSEGVKPVPKKRTKKLSTIQMDNPDIQILKKIFEDTSKWYLERIIEEKKQGFENLIDLFNGVPLGLGAFISQLIMNRVIKIDPDKLKECLIGYLGKTGVYELYSQLGKGAKIEAEIEVAEEIIIPPKVDQRLAPLQKQLKFEFMKYLETAKIRTIPIFNVLESHQIPPIKFVDLFLEQSQNTLVNIINFNAEQKLHQLVNLDPKEFEVKLKTLNLKLASFITEISKIFEKIIAEDLTDKKLKEEELFNNFKKGIEEIWVKSFIITKKIEPIIEPEITTSKVSALAAKLEGQSKEIAPDGSRPMPPRAAPPSAAAAPPGPLRAAPPSAGDRPAPPSAAAPPGPPRAAPPSAGDRPAPPSAAAPPGPPRAAPPSAGDRPAPPSGEITPSIGIEKQPGAIKTERSTDGVELTQTERELIPEIKRKVVKAPKKALGKGRSKSTKRGKIAPAIPKEKRMEAIEDPQMEKVNGTISGKVSSVSITKAGEETGPQVVDIGSLEDIKQIQGKKVESGKRKSPTIIQNIPEESATGTSPPSELSTTEIPDFAKREKEEPVSISKKTAKLKETIVEVIKIVESSMADINKLTPESLKTALQLVYRLRELEKMDISTINPAEIRQLADLAESVKNNKNIIIIQKEKLKHLQDKLNESALLALDARLELIGKIFEEFVDNLDSIILQLSGKGEKMLEHLGKKGGKEFRARQRIKKEGKSFSQQIDILKRFGELSLKKFEQAKRAYIAFQKARSEKKSDLIKKFSQEICDLIGIDREHFLNFTRDPKLKISLDDLFKIS